MTMGAGGGEGDCSVIADAPVLKREVHSPATIEIETQYLYLFEHRLRFNRQSPIGLTAKEASTAMSRSKDHYRFSFAARGILLRICNQHLLDAR